MFADPKQSHHNAHSTGRSPSGYASLNSSFSSSADSSSSWERISTPRSASQASAITSKTSDAYLSGSFYSPDVYGVTPAYCAMSAMTQDMMNDVQGTPLAVNYSENGKSLEAQAMMGYDNFSIYTAPLVDTFGHCHGLPSQIPSLDHDLSSPTSGDDSSPMSSNFVVPSQTFINEAYDLHSPLRPSALHLNLQYDSPGSDYTEEYSLPSSLSGSFGSSSPGSMTYLMPQAVKQRKSSSSTPTRPQASPFRQMKFEPLKFEDMAEEKPEVFHQAMKLEYDEPNKAGRQVSEKKRVKKEKKPMIMNNACRVEIENKPKKFCQWPGCGGRFQRQEHLKRHERTHTNIDCFPCICCPKEFNRTDNLKSHAWLHTQQKKLARTKYVPESVAWYEELCLRGKPRRPVDEHGVKVPLRTLPVRINNSACGRSSVKQERSKLQDSECN